MSGQPASRAAAEARYGGYRLAALVQAETLFAQFVAPTPVRLSTITAVALVSAPRAALAAAATPDGFASVAALGLATTTGGAGGATVTADAVRIRFRPDPALWPQGER